jgi:hypothetical protein
MTEDIEEPLPDGQEGRRWIAEFVSVVGVILEQLLL